MSLNAYICNAVEQKQDTPNIVAQVSNVTVNVEKTKDELMNEAVLSLAELNQKLLHCYINIVKAFPYDEDDECATVDRPYSPAIQGYYIQKLIRCLQDLSEYCDGYDAYHNPEVSFKKIEREIEDIKEQILANNLKNYLEDIIRLMDLDD